MRRLLIFLLLFVSEASAQSSIRLYFNRVDDFYKQTVIAFTDSTTDEVDVCCDAFQFGVPDVSIWTWIGSTRYAINAFGLVEEDKLIPLGVSSWTNNGYFMIGVDSEDGEKLSYRLIDSEFPGQFISLPYLFSGPIYEDRFALYLDKSTEIEVIPGCDYGKISIDNDDDENEYRLYSNGELISTYSSETDTIYSIPDGDYQLISGEFAEIDSFSIQNTIINASLWVSAQNVWINDAYIEGIVTIYTPFDSIHWDFGDGTGVDGDTNPVHLYQESGAYILKVTVKRGSCEKTYQSIITVQSPNGLISVQNPVKFRAQVRTWDLAGRRLR